MSKAEPVRPVEVAVEIAASPETAFAAFVDEIGLWWPAEYSWSQDQLRDMRIEPWLNGKCYETGPYGFRCDWGRVLEIEAPNLVAFTWQISPNREPEPRPERASVVRAAFGPAGKGARCVLRHEAFEKHGEGAGGYRDGMASEYGWPLLVKRFAKHAEGRG